jgi:hypothetical protein
MDYTRWPQGGVGPGATSGSTFDYGPNNEHPNLHDFQQLETIYAVDTDSATPGHADTTTTLKQGGGHGHGHGPGTVVDTGNGPENVGDPVDHHGDGRPHTFVRRLGHDGVVVTHVYWAE